MYPYSTPSILRMIVIGFVRSRITAGIVCVLCCLGAYHCFVAGLSGPTADSAQKIADIESQKMIAEIERRNPEAAAELARMRAHHDHVALAATLKGREQREGVDGIAQLAAYHGNPDSPQYYDLRLADVAAKTRFVSHQQRSDFIFAHGIPMQQQHDFFDSQNVPLSQSPINDYIRTLEFATKDDKLWSRVRENPMMVFLLQQNVSQELLDFYDAEKDWLDDVLFLVLSIGNADDESEILMPQDVLQTLWKNHPHFKNAWQDALSFPENDAEITACTLYALFANYGEVLRYCVDSGLMPISEFLDVVFANVDYFDKHGYLRPEDFAAKLITIRDSHPAVWQMAKQRPLYLELYDRLPHLANSLSEKHGHDDIAMFLFTKYDEDGSIPAAAAAINKFGDPAIYILNRYENSDDFRKALRDNDLGVRIIPYVARFEDYGLERLSANQNWLDKYFDEEGNTKAPEWWVDIPGGAIVNVARNWANGHPNEWSELGWAALDTATIVTIPFTFGGSTTATTAARGGTTAVKVGSKTVARTTAVSLARSGARATGTGARASAQQGTGSLFRQALVRQAGRSMFLSLAIRSVDGIPRIVVQIVQATTNFARTVGAMVYSSVRNIRAGWAGLAPTTRLAICRGLFYSGLATIIHFRTIPMLKEQWSNIDPEVWARQLANMLADLPKTVAGALVAGFDELLKRAGITGSVGRALAYFSGVATFGVGAVLSGRRALFSRRRFVATG